MGNVLLPCDKLTQALNSIQTGTKHPIHGTEMLTNRFNRSGLSLNSGEAASDCCFGFREADCLCAEIKNTIPFS